MKDDVPKIMLANFWSLYKAAGFNITRSALSQNIIRASK
jgi:hypothetical protein